MQDVYKNIDEYNDPKAFIEYSNDMQDVYNDPKAFNEYSNDIQNEFNIKYSNDMQDVYKDTNEKRKILIFFHDMIADMINNKKLNSIVTELFIRGRKLNFLLFLLRNHILRFQKMLDWILLTFLSQKSQKKRTSTNCIKSFIRY